MEPEPSITALLKAITALTATVGSLQDQIRLQSQQLIKLKAICKERPPTYLVTRTKEPKPAWPIDWACHSPTHTGGEAHTPGTVRPGLKAPFHPSRGTSFDSEEEEPRREPKKEPQGTPRRHLSSLILLTQGDTRGQKATQWLDCMLLWVALHRDQFDKEEQMVVQSSQLGAPPYWGHHQGQGESPYYHPGLNGQFKEAFANPDAKRAAARKIAALTQTSTTSEYVTKFCNLIAELDWNKEVYIAQFTHSLHWKVKELLSTKDNIPDKLEAILLPPSKLITLAGKMRRISQKSNQPSPEDPNYVTLEERDCRCASGLCVKCGQKGHRIKQCPNGWKATIKAAKIAEDKLGKE
ncbi:Retrotransposon-derived protein PEG10 [Rhizoctonia solani]|uniref:Retrotransposon-derived protein PEG10 n=1 Tax=Rhizoctonia solani TaxID=456999 RepID=A0A8H8SXG1_9AGAM|nr:Retrotransposon-derived protein PEG10 [Rhizoctonia solani]QRW20517.1 Retrotransposon-derived protein PEG10 [Rhizoctonia solani]